MKHCYSAYGLSLGCDAFLTGFIELDDTPNPDIQILLQERPPWFSASAELSKRPFYLSPQVNAKERHLIAVWEVPSAPGFHIAYDDGTEFFLDSKGTEIWATWPDSLSIEDATVFLRGPIMGFLLRLRGRVALHASAIDIGGRAILLMGPPGAGKSTTAAWFARSGNRMLSDDIVPLIERGGTFLAQPGYPRLCLWPKSVEALFGRADLLPLIASNWTKRFLSLDESASGFTKGPLPISGIYWLDEACEDLDSPAIESLAPKDSFIALVGNSYMNYLLDETMRVKEFEVLGRLSAKIPVRRVRPRQDLLGLDELCQLIQRDFAFLPEPAFR